MAVNKLNLNFNKYNSHINIKGSRNILSRNVEGNWATIFKGQGMEFTGYRNYNPTDDASIIDWKASLRNKELLVREFEEFKNFNVFFFLDTSNSMLYTTGDKFKAEFGAEVLYSLFEEASFAGDAVGMATFNTKITSKIMPAFGKGMRYRFINVLSNTENYGGERDFRKSMLELYAMLPEKSIIILISDFLGLPEDWSKYIDLFSSRHYVMGIMIRDKRDRELSIKGQFAVKDPNSTETLIFDAENFSKQYKELSKQDEEKVQRVFKKVKSDCLVLENEISEPRVPVRRFFTKMSQVNS
jgi:uncharacterized protein (DUF58 family)